MYEISLCDHIPLYFELEFHGVQRQELHAVTETNHTEYFWIPLAKMSKEDKTEYVNKLDFLVSDLPSVP